METRFLEVPGGRLAYDDQGTGPLVICTPGMGVVRSDYRLLTPHLLAAGYRVVTLDPRGQGESSARWPGYTVAEVGADILALARALDAGPALLIGGSMAAGAVVWAAVEAPPRVAGVALLAPVVRDTQPRWQANLMNALLNAPVLLGPWGPGAWRGYLRSLYPTGQPADLDSYLDRVTTVMREPGRMRALYAMATASKAASAERLARVAVPATVVIGTKDRDFAHPEAEARFVATSMARPGAFHLIEGVGHYPEAEAVEQTAPIIVAFLNSVREGASYGG